LFEESFRPAGEKIRIHAFTLTVPHHRSERFGDIHMGYGRVRVFSRVTREKEDLVFVVAKLGPFDFRCSIKPFATVEDLEALERDLFEALRRLHVVDLMRKIDQVFGDAYFALKDLLREDRIRVTDLLTRETLERAHRIYDRLYEENRRINEVYRSVNLPLPSEFKFSAESALNRRVGGAVRELAEKNFPPEKARHLMDLLRDAETLGVEIHKERLALFLDDELLLRMERFVQSPRGEIIDECQNLLRIAKRARMNLEMRRAQSVLLKRIKEWRADPSNLPGDFASYIDRLALLIRDLKFHPQVFQPLAASDADGRGSAPGAGDRPAARAA